MNRELFGFIQVVYKISITLLMENYAVWLM